MTSVFGKKFILSLQTNSQKEVSQLQSIFVIYFESSKKKIVSLFLKRIIDKNYFLSEQYSDVLKDVLNFWAKIFYCPNFGQS